MSHNTFEAEDASTEEEQEIAGMSRFISEVFKGSDSRTVASALVSTLIFMIWHSATDFDAAIEETLDGVRHMADLYKAKHERQTGRLQ